MSGSYAVGGGIKIDPNTPKDKTKKLAEDFMMPTNDFLDADIGKLTVFGKEVNDEYELQEKTLELKSVLEPLSIFEQAKRGIKAFPLNFDISAEEFCKLVGYGATYIKTPTFLYKKGVEMKYLRDNQKDYNHLVCADVPKVTGQSYSGLCTYDRLPPFHKSIKSFTSRYILEGYYCSNSMGTAFGEDALPFIQGYYPIAYKNLDECVARDDNTGHLYVSSTERGLLRDNIAKYVTTNSNPYTSRYLVNYLLEIVSKDRVTNMVSDWRTSPPTITNSIRTFKDGFPRPLEEMPMLAGYVFDMSIADKSFVYAFIDAMKFFDNQSMKFTKHFSSLFYQLMDAPIYVYKHHNFRVNGEYSYGDGISGIHLFKSKSEAEEYRSNGGLSWDIRYAGEIDIKLDEGGYSFNKVDILGESIKKTVHNGSVLDAGNITMTEHINLDSNLDTITYFLKTNDDGSVTITWKNNTDIDAKFFQIDDKKIKIGV